MPILRIEVSGFKTEVREFPKTKKGQAESVKYCTAVKKEFDQHPFWYLYHKLADLQVKLRSFRGGVTFKSFYSINRRSEESGKGSDRLFGNGRLQNQAICLS
jgi:hypothetical protein